MGRPVLHTDKRGAADSYEAADRCVHCGLSLGTSHDTKLGPFCCAGCRTVYALIHDSGLDRFYDLRPSRIAPAYELRRDNQAWLDVLFAEQEHATGPVRLSLDIQGVHCAACVWLLEELFRRHEGGRILTINPALGTAEILWDRDAGELHDYLSDAEQFGYRFGPARKSRRSTSRALQMRMGVCIAAAMNVMMYSLAYYFGLAPRDGAAYVMFGRIIAALATVVLIVGGQPFLQSAWRGLRRGVVHLDLPIALGMTLGYGGSLYAYLTVGPEAAYFDTMTVFIALMLVGRWLQEHVLERNRNALLQSGGIADLFARRLENGVLHAVPAAEIGSGDELWIAPGDLVPVDGVLLHRAANVTLDWITGESRPEHREPGEKIPAGAFNADEAGFRLATVEPFSDSRLHELLRHSLAADGQRSERGWWHRVSTVYVALVLLLATAGFLSWVGQDARKAVEVTVGILVVTCPCALGLAVPLGRELIHVALRREGVLLRRDEFLDRALRIRRVLFDKTGTLTRSQLVLSDETRRALLRLPADKRRILWNMTARSNHPVSRTVAAALSIVPTGLEGGPDRELPPEFDGLCETSGAGLELLTAAGVWRFGRPEYACPSHAAAHRDATVFSLDGSPVLDVCFVEELKGDAVEEVRSLRDHGLSVHLLSGDTPERVAAAALRLGLEPDNAQGGLSPECKAAVVRDLDDHDTLMVGDGLNDSLSFDAAWCAATPAVDRAVLPQKADFYYLGDGVSAVRKALGAAERLHRVQRGNLMFAAAYNALAVGLCFAGVVTPVVAAVLMPISSVTVVTITTIRLGRRSKTAWMS